MLLCLPLLGFEGSWADNFEFVDFFSGHSRRNVLGVSVLLDGANAIICANKRL